MKNNGRDLSCFFWLHPMIIPRIELFEWLRNNHERADYILAFSKMKGLVLANSSDSLRIFLFFITEKRTHMISNTFVKSFSIRNKKYNNNSYRLLSVTLLLSFFIVSDVAAISLSEKNYLRIEKSQSSDKTDLSIKSFGGLIFNDTNMGHIDLTHLSSGVNGKSLALEFGGGYVFNWDISLFVGFGVSLIYNEDNNDYIVAYFPEVGIAVDLTNKIGITARSKRYHNLYDETENIIMMGMVFRN